MGKMISTQDRIGFYYDIHTKRRRAQTKTIDNTAKKDSLRSIIAEAQQKKE